MEKTDVGLRVVQKTLTLIYPIGPTGKISGITNLTLIQYLFPLKMSPQLAKSILLTTLSDRFRRDWRPWRESRRRGILW